MDKQRLQELGGVELTEEVNQATIRKEAGDLIIQVNKLHGNLIKAKSSNVKVPSSLEDALYKMTSELDKFIGEN